MAEPSTSATLADQPTSRQGTASPTGSVAPQATTDLELLPLDGEDLEADSDSACGESQPSGTTSLRSSIIAGVILHGRKYQSMRDNDINIPSDERQFESMEAAHMADTIMESQQENPFFRSPISPKAQHVLDLGTGQGGWAISVADRFPNLTVHGVDLYPPPAKWVPPNCIFEVDDFTKPWTWDHKFDLVHIRRLSGTLPTEEWGRLYKRAYHNLAPGGWIEHYDVATDFCCDDGSLPKDSLLAKFGRDMDPVVAQTGNAINVTELMKEGIEDAGFINVTERRFKFPIGDWPKHPVYKEAGAVNKTMYKDGFEGFLMYLLTRFGLPTPWAPEEVIVYIAKLRKELDQNYHIFNWHNRVWAQKPFDAPKEVPQPLLETVAPAA